MLPVFSESRRISREPPAHLSRTPWGSRTPGGAREVRSGVREIFAGAQKLQATFVFLESLGA